MTAPFPSPKTTRPRAFLYLLQEIKNDSECSCPTNALHLNERTNERTKENLGESEREGTATERGRERSTQYALKPTIVVSVGLIQESVSYCLLRPLWTTRKNVIAVCIDLKLSKVSLCACQYAETEYIYTLICVCNAKLSNQR